MFGILERTVVLEPLVKEFNGLNDEVEVSMIIDQFLSLSFWPRVSLRSKRSYKRQSWPSEFAQSLRWIIRLVNPIMMRIPSRCESYRDANSIAMWIPSRCESWWESNLDLNPIMMWITIFATKVKMIEIIWNLYRYFSLWKRLFSRSCTETYFQSCYSLVFRKQVRFSGLASVFYPQLRVYCKQTWSSLC